MAGTVSFNYYISSAFKWASEQLLLRGCYCTNLFLLSVYFESLVREREREKKLWIEMRQGVHSHPFTRTKVHDFNEVDDTLRKSLGF